MEFFGLLFKYFPRDILEKFFLYLIDSLNAFANFPELFFLLLNRSFKNLLIYICGHSTLDHFKVILNVFFARLSENVENPVSIQLPFLLNFIEKILLDSSFLAKIGGITKNTYKKEVNFMEIESKQAHLLRWVLSFEIFSKFSQISSFYSFSFFELIFREILSNPQNFSFMQNLKSRKNKPKNLFFEGIPELLSHFCYNLFNSDCFYGHLFLVLLTNELKLNVKTEHLKRYSSQGLLRTFLNRLNFPSNETKQFPKVLTNQSYSDHPRRK